MCFDGSLILRNGLDPPWASGEGVKGVSGEE